MHERSDLLIFGFENKIQYRTKKHTKAFLKIKTDVVQCVFFLIILEWACVECIYIRVQSSLPLSFI